MKNTVLFLLAFTFTLSALGKQMPQKQQSTPQPTVNADTTRLSAIDGVERLGPDPLVLIDGTEHDKEILYKISSKCIRGNSVLNPNKGDTNYGERGKDGVVVIKTRNQQITYLTANEKEYLLRKQAFKGMFFSRFTYKQEDGTLRDEARVKRDSGGGSAADLAPGGKIAFIIKDKVYNEEEFKRLFPVDKPDLGSSLSVGGSASRAKERGLNLEGYDLVFDFSAKPQL